MISHKHQCIFIHIPKTAGMSIEDTFIRSLGLRFYKGQCPPLLLSYNQDPLAGPPSLAHLLPEEYVEKGYISQALFDKYFKFTIVRNPWERIISIYKYFKYHRILSFEDFMKYRFPELWKDRYDFVRPQCDFIFDESGNKKVDFIGKFENLPGDFKTLKNILSHPLGDLRHINKPPRPHNWYSRWNRRFIFAEIRQRPYLLKNLNLFIPIQAEFESYYTDDAKKIVENYYKRDIEILDY